MAIVYKIKLSVFVDIFHDYHVYENNLIFHH